MSYPEGYAAAVIGAASGIDRAAPGGGVLDRHSWIEPAHVDGKIAGRTTAAVL